VIRSDAELEEVWTKLQEQEARIVTYRSELERDGLAAIDVERALDPVRSFAQQLRESVDEYERLRRGELPEMTSLDDLGSALIAARVAAGVSQRELAVRLGVHESQVSRDEKNDYHGVTIERASKVLATIGVKFRGALSLERSAPVEARGL
jgi:ribosome-binding protein aMBF1 (putative translation factor)